MVKSWGSRQTDLAGLSASTANFQLFSLGKVSYFLSASVSSTVQLQYYRLPYREKDHAPKGLSTVPDTEKHSVVAIIITNDSNHQLHFQVRKESQDLNARTTEAPKKQTDLPAQME